jgi:hypothetical protein
MQKSLENVPEVSFRGLGRDLMSYVADADFLCQFSDTEGYAFSMHEALSVNTPVLATAFPNAFEQITEGKNGYILPFELFRNGTDKEWKKVLDKLYKKLEFEFKPLSSEEDWIKIIGKPDGKRKKVKVKQPDKIMIKCIKAYKDVQLERRVLKGEVLEVSKPRAKHLEVLGVASILVNFTNKDNGETKGSTKREITVHKNLR